MQMNGHRVVPPPDHTSILVDMSGRIGRLEGGVGHIVGAVRRIEARLDQPAVPAWETMVKAIAPYIILPLVAWATGSWQAATEVVRQLVAR